MHKVLFFLIAFFTLVLFCDCSEKKTNRNTSDISIIKVDTEGSIDKVNCSEIFSDIRYIPLDTGENLIGEISNIISFKNKLFILDSDITKTVFCYNTNGEFLFKINSVGEGPEEYINLTSISIDEENEQLLLYSNASRKILKYNLEGNLIEVVNIDFFASKFSYVGNGNSVFLANYSTIKEGLEKDGKLPNIIITNSDYKIINTAGYFTKDIYSSAIPKLFTNFNPLSGNELSLIQECNDTIYHIQGGNIRPAYYIDFGNKKKSDKFYELINSPEDDIDKITNYLKNNDVCDIASMVETEKLLFITYIRKNFVHYLFCNKKEKTLIDTRFRADMPTIQVPVENDMNGGPFPTPMFSDGNLIYSMVQPYDLKENREKINDSNYPGKQELVALIDKLSEYDNPVIVTYHPK